MEIDYKNPDIFLPNGFKTKTCSSWSMKIRTITVGFPYQPHMKIDDFRTIAHITKRIKQSFLDEGYQVQTIRMSTQPWNEYAKTKHDIITHTKRLDQWIHDEGIDYFNIGPAADKKHISWIPEILSTISNGFSTAIICDHENMFYDHIEEAAKIIKKNAEIEPQGFTNLRFAALCNVKPFTPFFPASYHQQSPPSFGIGFENSDLVYQAFKNAGNLRDASYHLRKTFIERYQAIQQIAIKISENNHIIYDGIDTSISTSIDEHESIAYAYEYLLKGYHFGQPATLSISKTITDIIQQLPIKKTGYCGLMLPVLEDHGLAMRNMQGCFSIADLLHYSSVCGTGLDTIPLPGDCTIDEIKNILYDVATLSIKLKKPLSARLMPIPGKKPGDMTEFSFQYFKNSTVMNPR